MSKNTIGHKAIQDEGDASEEETDATPPNVKGSPDEVPASKKHCPSEPEIPEASTGVDVCNSVPLMRVKYPEVGAFL